MIELPKHHTDIEVIIHAECSLQDMRRNTLLCLETEAMDSEKNPKATAHYIRALAELELAVCSLQLARAEIQKCTIQE